MWEILVVLGLLFVVVGPGKLPGLAKKLGEQIRGLKDGLAEVRATVDADDEFVKAVSEARRTVVEAKEAVREIIDDVVSVADDRGGEARDRAPRPVPRGRKMVSRGRSQRPPRRRVTAGSALVSGEEVEASQADETPPAPPEESVEMEDSRSSSPRREADDLQRLVVEDRGDVEDEQGGARSDRAQTGSGDEAEPAGDGRTSGRSSSHRRPSAGRRMVKPGRDRAGEGE